MDTSSTLIALLIVIICILPFAMLYFRRRKKVRAILHSLHSLAGQSGRSISEHDIWGDRVIGMDEDESNLFAILKIDGGTRTYKISLGEIRECRLIQNVRTIRNKEGVFTVTDLLGLAFVYADTKKGVEALEFYNPEFDQSTLSGELQLAEKWHRLVSNALKHVGVSLQSTGPK